MFVEESAAPASLSGLAPVGIAMAIALSPALLSTCAGVAAVWWVSLDGATEREFVCVFCAKGVTLGWGASEATAVGTVPDKDVCVKFCGSNAAALDTGSILDGANVDWPAAEAVRGNEEDMISELRGTLGCAKDSVCVPGRDVESESAVGCPRRGPRCAAAIVWSVVPEAMARAGCLALAFTMCARLSNSHHTGANVI